MDKHRTLALIMFLNQGTDLAKSFAIQAHLDIPAEVRLLDEGPDQAESGIDEFEPPPLTIDVSLEATVPACTASCTATLTPPRETSA